MPKKLPPQFRSSISINDTAEMFITSAMTLEELEEQFPPIPDNICSITSEE